MANLNDTLLYLACTTQVAAYESFTCKWTDQFTTYASSVLLEKINDIPSSTSLKRVEKVFITPLKVHKRFAKKLLKEVVELLRQKLFHR